MTTVVSYGPTCVFEVWGVFKGTWPDWDLVWLVSLRCLFQSVNTDMPRPFRLFSTPATRDKGNSEIKSATTTTTGKHMIWLSTSTRKQNTLCWRKARERRVRRSHCYDICPDVHITAWYIHGLAWINAAVFSWAFPICLFNSSQFLVSVLLRLKAVYTFKCITSDALCCIYAYIYML